MNRISDIFFIDLEQTIIDSWQGVELINVAKIKKFLVANNAKIVHVFSFAIWSDDDKARFVKVIKPLIENALGIPVGLFPSVKQMIVADREFTGVHFDKDYEVSEFIQLRGKKDAFIHYVLAQMRFDRAVLIDDVVPDLTVTHRIDGWSIELWNVDSI